MAEDKAAVEGIDMAMDKTVSQRLPPRILQIPAGSAPDCHGRPRSTWWEPHQLPLDPLASQVFSCDKDKESCKCKVCECCGCLVSSDNTYKRYTDSRGR